VVKSSPEFVALREEVLRLIWGEDGGEETLPEAG
jgi:hypothetical protein